MQVLNLTEDLPAESTELADEGQELRIFDFGSDRLEFAAEGTEGHSMESTLLYLQRNPLLTGLRQLGCPIIHPGTTLSFDPLLIL